MRFEPSLPVAQLTFDLTGQETGTYLSICGQAHSSTSLDEIQQK